MADNHDPLSGAHLGGNHHPTGLIPRNNAWHINEQGLGRASKNSNHLSHDNQIPKVRHTLLWRRETEIFTKRGRHPLHSVRVFHGTLSGQIVSINNHDHGTISKNRLPAVYPHPGKRPYQAHQYPHDKQASFLKNNRNRGFLPHTTAQRHRTTKDEPT